MFWQEDNQIEQYQSQVVDLAFSVRCRQIPVDHAHALSSAVRAALPWLEQEPAAAIHLMHVAGSQNGWERPQHSTEQFLLLPKRARFTLRLPNHRIDEASRLSGQTLDIAGNPMLIGESHQRPLSRLGTLFSRFIACDPQESEQQMLLQLSQELAQLGVRIRKALCGKSTELYTPDGPLFTRSLMLADLPGDESLRLQEHGLGSHRLMGCGIFIPHKGIDAVNKTTDDVGG